MKLDPKAFGLTAGLFAGAWWLAAMSFSLLTGIGMRTLKTLGAFHPGFQYSWGGVLWMGALHLMGLTVLGWLFARLYNKLVR